ncbi:MAG: F0F1 ATP synthase subunit B [Clostridia bacterium]|nr:F0F1 ATP synthase subunit B [Clostridia bacterium]
MQTLEVISLNFWDIVISLCNLLIIFLILKKFLYAPVRNVLEKRKNQLEKTKEDAEAAKAEAIASKERYEEKLNSADQKAEAIIEKAKSDAEVKGNVIITDAKKKAGLIMDNARIQIESDKRHAEAQIKEEIADLSAELAGKLLEREISTEDHKDLIDSFITEIDSAEDHK